MVNNSGKHGKQTRKGVTIQLVEGVDDDLIEAIDAIEDRGEKRQPTLKQWLRESLGFATATQPAAFGGASPDHSEAFSHLGEGLEWLKTAMINLQPYLEKKFATISVRAGVPFGAEPEPPPKEEVSQEVLDRRKERLGKRGW
jgi:hypothetical protein